MAYICKRDGKDFPNYEFDFDNRLFIIKGISSDSNPEAFYENLIKEIENNKQSIIKKDISLCCEFEYVNTSSTRCILRVISKFCEISNKVMIDWSYDANDDDTEELGTYCEEELLGKYKNVKINMIEKMMSN